MDLKDPNRWRFTSQSRRFQADDGLSDASGHEVVWHSVTGDPRPPMSSDFPEQNPVSDIPTYSRPRRSPVPEANAHVEERIKVVIGGRAYILNSTRDRATILAIASEADHLLEHLKLTHGNLSEVALSTLAVANVLDQKNEIFALYEEERARAEFLEERLESVYQELSQERYQARSKPRNQAKKKRKGAPRKSTPSRKKPRNSASPATAEDLAGDENALEEAQQSLADYLERLENDEL